MITNGEDGDPAQRLGSMDLELINFDEPTETRTFEKGRFEVYEAGLGDARARDLSRVTGRLIDG